MKLFTKTFLFFIGIIIIQTNLTFFTITNIIRKNNLEDAKKELTEESNVVYESYNAWKRSLWVDLITLRGDEKLKRMLLDSAGVKGRDRFLAYIKDSMLAGGIDCVVIKSTSHPHIELIPRDYSIFTLSDLEGLRNEKPHPYLRTALVGRTRTLRVAARREITASAIPSSRRR